MLPQVAKLKGIAVDFLFPQWCVGCGKVGSFLCQSCLQSLERIAPPICPQCGLPQPESSLCPRCVGWRSQIDGIRSPFRFDGVMRKAIHQLKYGNIRALATPLAELLKEYLETSPIPGEVLVPVPLHDKRLRERGYNQSRLLTRELGRLINLPVVDDCLIRHRHTPPQVKTTSVEERQNNVTDAFACKNHRLKGKRVLLIDDVATSGNTLNACAIALKTAGASSVWGLVMAREL